MLTIPEIIFRIVGLLQRNTNSIDIKTFCIRGNRYVGKDYTLYIKSIEILKSLFIIADAKKIGLLCGLLFLYAEKAFDRLEVPVESLGKIQIQPKFY